MILQHISLLGFAIIAIQASWAVPVHSPPREDEQDAAPSKQRSLPLSLPRLNIVNRRTGDSSASSSRYRLGKDAQSIHRHDAQTGSSSHLSVQVEGKEYLDASSPPSGAKVSRGISIKTVNQQRTSKGAQHKRMNTSALKSTLSEKEDGRGSLRASLRVGSRSQLNFERRQAFNEVWNKLQLSTDMTPEALAQGVTSMRGHGLPPKSIASFAKTIVEDNKEPQYVTRYLGRMAQLVPKFNAESRRIKKDPRLSHLDPQMKLRLALEDTFHAVNSKERKSIFNSTQVTPKKSSQVSIDKVRKVMQNHLQNQGKSLEDITLAQLEEESRGLGHDDMTSNHFTRSFFNFLKQKKGASKSQILALKRVRKNAATREWKRKKLIGDMARNH